MWHPQGFTVWSKQSFPPDPNLDIIYTVIIVVDRMRMELVKEQLTVESHFWLSNISLIDDSLKSW